MLCKTESLRGGGGLPHNLSLSLSRHRFNRSCSFCFPKITTLRPERGFSHRTNGARDRICVSSVVAPVHTRMRGLSMISRWMDSLSLDSAPKGGHDAIHQPAVARGREFHPPRFGGNLQNKTPPLSGPNGGNFAGAIKTINTSSSSSECMRESVCVSNCEKECARNLILTPKTHGYRA